MKDASTYTSGTVSLKYSWFSAVGTVDVFIDALVDALVLDKREVEMVMDGELGE